MSTGYTQETRRMGLRTPLGTDKLLLISFSGHEEVSRLFSYELDLRSEQESIAAKDIVGKNVTFWVDFVDGSHRFFNGFVSRFTYSGQGDRLHIYKARVVPWLWFLTQSSDCRIFQDKNVIDILGEVFGDLGFSDFTDKTEGDFKTRPYCVQYRETDFNFVSRLMEEEGMFYYFEHQDGSHKLVLGNSTSAYHDCKDKEVQFLSNLSAPEVTDQLTRWEHQYEYRTGKYSQREYNFEDPAQNLETNKTTIVQLEKNKSYEYYDYPGRYKVKSDGDTETQIRMEELESAYDVVHGESICRSFSPGGKFKIKDHHVSAEKNKSYVITSVRHLGSVGGTYLPGGVSADGEYGNAFTCIPDKVAFHSSRVTPKPTIQGVQTAVVVGPSGQEIFTDKYGRVKVQFHWDRDGQKDDKSSCWIRCAQSMAGKQWGAMFIPRIGQEVVITYEEGDPDRPLVTGVVYNAAQMPAYTLPDEKTKSYLKTNSSPGGEGYNEVRFEDKADEEQIFIHAQRNMDTRVQNDEMHTIRGNAHLTVGDKEQGSYYELIHGKKQIHVKQDQAELIDGKLEEAIGGDHHLKVGGAQNVEVGGQISVTAAGCQEKLQGDLVLEAGGNLYLKAGMSVVIQAGMKLSLVVGGNFVDVSPMGVAINGTMVLINSGGAPGTATPPNPTKPSKASPSDPEPADDSQTGRKSCN